MITEVYIDDTQIHETVTCTKVLTRMAGLGSPPPRRESQLRASTHGAIDRTRFYEGRPIEIEGLIVDESDLVSWTTFDTIKGKLALGSDHTVRFRRSGMSEDEQVTVRVASDVDHEQRSEGRVIRWGVSLYAADPRIYSFALKSGSYDPTTALGGGGAPMPLVFPIVFSTSTVTHLQLGNLGNFPSPPVLTVKGPVVNPIIDNDSTGESIYLVYSLGASDSIIVDVAARSVKLNGASRLDLLLASTSKWWQMQAGTNKLRLRGSGMASSQTLLTCQYRDARI